MGGKPIEPDAGVTIKAYEVDAFWVPVKTLDGTGIRYYSFTKFPEIGVNPTVTKSMFVGAFEPEPELPVLKDGADPLRDPLILVA